MRRYLISQIQNITGISAHRLRKWESRYKFISPARNQSQIRYYTDSDLRTLLNVNVLLNNGYRFSQIDKLSKLELNTKSFEFSTIENPKIEDIINQLSLSMLNLDEVMFKEIFDRQVDEFGFLSSIERIVYPLLNRVGILWCSERATPANEHFISNLIRQKIIVEIDNLSLPSKDVSSIVLFTPHEEHHEIGLLMADYIIKSKGWRTYYLGLNVPLENIKQVVAKVDPNYLFTRMTDNTLCQSNITINRIINSTNKQLLLSGDSRLIEYADNERVIFLKEPKDLISFLNNQNSDQSQGLDKV